MISQFIRAVLSCNYPTLFWGERSFILVRIVGIWFLIYFGYANLLKLLAFQNNLSGLKTISGYLIGRRLKAPGGLPKIKNFVLCSCIIQMTERFKRSENVFSESVCLMCASCEPLYCAVRCPRANWCWWTIPGVPRSDWGCGPSLLILSHSTAGPLSRPSCCCGVVEPRLLLANCCCDPQHSDLRISVECHLPDPLQGSMA